MLPTFCRSQLDLTFYSVSFALCVGWKVRGEKEQDKTFKNKGCQAGESGLKFQCPADQGTHQRARGTSHFFILLPRKWAQSCENNGDGQMKILILHLVLFL